MRSSSPGRAACSSAAGCGARSTRSAAWHWRRSASASRPNPELVRLRREVDGGHVFVAVAELDAALEGRFYGARDARFDARPVGCLEHERRVLRGELQLEARLQPPLEHRL